MAESYRCLFLLIKTQVRLMTAPLILCYQIIRFNIAKFCFNCQFHSTLTEPSLIWNKSFMVLSHCAFYGKKMDVVVNFDLTTCHKKRTLQFFLCNLRIDPLYIFSYGVSPNPQGMEKSSFCNIERHRNAIISERTK